MPKLIAVLNDEMFPGVNLSDPKELQQVASRLLNQLLSKVEDDGSDSRDHLLFKAALYRDVKDKFRFHVVEDKDLENVTQNDICNAIHIARWPAPLVVFVYHCDNPSDPKELEKKLLSRSIDLKSFKSITFAVFGKIIDLNVAEVISTVPTANMSFDQLKDLNDRAVISGATTAKWQPFFERIQEMEEYGNKLLSKGVKEKGKLVCKLADDIRDQAIALLKQRDPISEVSLRDFKQTVHNMLTDKNTHDLLAEHRPTGASWKIVAGNVIFALTGIGAIAIGIWMAYTKLKTGHALLLFSPEKTTSEKKAEKVDEAIHRLN